MNAAELSLAADLSPSAAIYRFVADQETFSEVPYLGAGGEWVQGWGHTRGVTKDSPPITHEISERWLAEDLERAADTIRTWVSVPLTQGQFDALVSLVFTTGTGRQGQKSGFVWLKSGQHSTLLTKINAGDYIAAGAEFARWVHSGGKRLGGLEKRRELEMKMWKGDQR